MTPLAWLLGLALPACGANGAAGLPVPPPMNPAAIVRPSSPNTALAAPASFVPAPDIATPVYDVPPEALFAAIRAVAEAEPRVFLAASYDDRLQAHYVVRSAVFNFPDQVMVQARAVGTNMSALVLYSRSVYGYSDLGANRKRIGAWLAALDRRLASDRGH
ncbi:MAG: DUF1499 domain-containing protein [Acetobacteraceae bacterium]